MMTAPSVIRQAIPTPLIFRCGWQKTQARSHCHADPGPNKVGPLPIIQAIETLKFLHPGGDTFEICAIAPKTPTSPLWVGRAYGKKPIIAGWFRDPAGAAKLAVQIEAEGIYTTLNACQEALLARADHRLKASVDRTADHHIIGIKNLPIDIDPIRPSGISSTDQEHDAAVEMARFIKADLAKEGWPEPLFGDSGNGAHLNYPLDLPNDPESVRLVKTMLEALALRYQEHLARLNLEIDQAVFNPARLTKLYGTMVRKGDSTTDRPHRLAQIISLPETRQPVPLELLQKLAATVQCQTQPKAKEAGRREEGRFDVETYLKHYGVEVVKVKPHAGGMLYCLQECLFDPSHSGNEAAIGRAQDGRLFYQCFHNSCKGRTWKEAREKISGTDNLNQFGVGARGRARTAGPEARTGQEDAGAHATQESTEFTDAELLNFARAGQVGDAQLFIRLFKGFYCYDHAAGRWYQWKNHYWAEDDLNSTLTALDCVIDLYERAAQRCAWTRARAARDGNDALAKQAAAEEAIFIKKIAQLQKRDWRRDVLCLAAAGEGSLGITGNEWDRNPLLIACPNGVVDLDTGGFRDGRPDDFIKTVCPTEWLGQLEPAPLWDKFIFEIFNSDPDNPGLANQEYAKEYGSYMQRLCGYALSGQGYERELPVCCGEGWNGKGTLFETLGYVLGNLAGPVPAEILLEESKHHHKSGGAPTPEIMRLRGKRLVWASETNEGRRFNAGKAKWLSGGDTLIGRDPFAKKMVAFPPTHTIFLMTNHRPKANPDDFALWGRIHLIDFKLSFVDKPTEPHHRRRDKHLKEKLKKEASGILAWLVHGYYEWKEKGLQPPANVNKSTEQYRQHEDTVGQFIKECCIINKSVRVQASKFYQEYKKWCEENGYKPLWGNTFADRVSKKFKKKEENRANFYVGVGFLE
jgi:putative DNA primase/helicase